MIKTRGGILDIIMYTLLLSMLVSSCANTNPSEKTACEKSGGEYKMGVSEGGAYYYCNCPATKYEKNKICLNIDPTEMQLCQNLSNKFVNCDNNQGVCECIFKGSGTKSYIPYAQLKTMSCECDSNGCGCMSVE